MDGKDRNVFSILQNDLNSINNSDINDDKSTLSSEIVCAFG